ncbi:MAG: hypothetical protein LBL90_03500 [Prevotellaceae bacterium]|jgi:hypothetical protein|nr:hypothetical protein [Prevotellaceae bacterium]
MDSPFIYVKEVGGENFVGRKEELTWLSSNMLNSQNAVIIASPRYGKTSLIRQAALQVQKQDLNLKFCYLNIFNVREAYEFYAKLANEIVKTLANTSDTWVQIAQRYLPLTAPQVNIDSKQNEIYLQFDTEVLKQHRDEIVMLPQKLALDYNLKIVLCIEEFQNIEYFEDEYEFQKYIACTWKKHDSVTYIISGSKKNLMRELFEREKRPFYNFGDILYLEPIDEKIFAEYITKSFSKSGRVIQKELAEKLCRIVQNYPCYMQLFAGLVWKNTKGFVTERLVENTVEDLMNYYDHTFNQLTGTLSNSQVNYIKAVIDGVDRFCSAENINKYHLNSSANITRVRGALEKKEIIEFVKGKPRIINPVYELWFRHLYMKYFGAK